MLCISSNRHSAFRSEEVESISLVKNTDTHRFTNKICIDFKSGTQRILECKNIKEAKEFFEILIKAMKQDYHYTFKYTGNGVK